MHGNKLRILRLSRGFDQTTFAQSIGLTQNTYSRMENNKQKIPEDILLKMAEKLGVSEEDIKSQEPVVISINNSPNSKGIYHIEQFFENQKELFIPILSTLESFLLQIKEERKEITAERIRVLDLLNKIIEK